MSKKVRYAIAGLSTRGIYAFVQPLIGKSPSQENSEFAGTSDLVAIIEPDRERAETWCRAVGAEFPIYSPGDFDRALAEHQPDRLLITGPDFTHHDYLVRGLAAGLDVITEKPMVVSAEQARDALAREAESRGQILVAHNYRYMPLMQRLKALLLEGRIGRVTNIELTYNLDTAHGSS